MALRPRLARVFHPFERFFRLEASSSILLLAAAVAAIVWANSPAGQSYLDLWSTQVTFAVGAFKLDKPLLLWVNDGLMAIFFLLVGLEIKRELIRGELSTRSAATLPVAAALGGMVAPALIYLAITRGTPAVSGWGIPMATDIAFALGALAILGRGLPPSLRVFLAATAIVDDIGAVLVIALVYTPNIVPMALFGAAIVFLLMVGLNRMNIQQPWPYVLLAIALWVFVLKSGVHATVAGVLAAFTIPATRLLPALGPATGDTPVPAAAPLAPEDSEDRAARLLAEEHAIEEQEALLTRMEHALVPWVAYFILPVFALANAGVVFEGALGDVLLHPVTIGIILGLVVGKQIGIFLFPWMAVKLGWAAMPPGATWSHIYGIAWLGGIGFTMSLFIAGLALPADLLPNAKVGVMLASVVAAAGGALILMRSRARRGSPA